MLQEEVKLRENLAKCVYAALLQICGGSFPHEAERKQIQEIASKTISFPNPNNSSANGKPHDIEIRVALPLFHRWKRATPAGKSVNIQSDLLGLEREISSPRHLAEILCIPLESACKEEGIARTYRRSQTEQEGRPQSRSY